MNQALQRKGLSAEQAAFLITEANRGNRAVFPYYIGKVAIRKGDVYKWTAEYGAVQGVDGWKLSGQPEFPVPQASMARSLDESVWIEDSPKWARLTQSLFAMHEQVQGQIEKQKNDISNIFSSGSLLNYSYAFNGAVKSREALRLRIRSKLEFGYVKEDNPYAIWYSVLAEWIGQMPKNWESKSPAVALYGKVNPSLGLDSIISALEISCNNESGIGQSKYASQYTLQYENGAFSAGVGQYEERHLSKAADAGTTPEGTRTGGPRLESRSFADYSPSLAAAVRKFAAAHTVDEMLPLVRDRERVESKIRAYYNLENPWKPIEINNKFDPSEVFTVDRDFIHLQLTMVNYAEIPIAFERDGDSFLADWESFTGYGEMSWDEFMKQRPKHPVLMRVVIEKSTRTDYYNEDFTDQARFACYQLRDRISQHFLSGYAPPGSLVDTKIRQHLHRLPAPSATTMQTLAVVRVRYPAHSTNSRQVGNHRVSPKWLGLPSG